MWNQLTIKLHKCLSEGEKLNEKEIEFLANIMSDISKNEGKLKDSIDDIVAYEMLKFDNVIGKNIKE